MSFITWISDPNTQLEDLVSRTKKQSYDFGRRLFSFQIAQQKYWLKFHEVHTQPVLEQAFQQELSFYQQNSYMEMLLAHQIIQFDQTPLFEKIANHGQGMILIDAAEFFTSISDLNHLEAIKQKISDALNVLEEIHQIGWVHGDLKVEHFRLYKDSCKLIDFEQSFKVQYPLASMNATPHYMAPELFHGKAKSIQSDLYAFGIIVYEWLTQTRLRAQTYHDWALLHCQLLEIQLPEHLKCFFPLLKGLLQKHVEQRFNSVWDVKEHLNAIDLL